MVQHGQEREWSEYSERLCHIYSLIHDSVQRCQQEVGAKHLNEAAIIGCIL